MELFGCARNCFAIRHHEFCLIIAVGVTIGGKDFALETTLVLTKIVSFANNTTIVSVEFSYCSDAMLFFTTERLFDNFFSLTHLS